MKTRTVLLVVVVAGAGISQTRQMNERPVRQAVRGNHGAVAAGSEYATEAGMRMYYRGGNAVDVGVATMFAASVTELSHFGLGGEAPILIRTKDGKVHAIAGVGTMPKLATADMYRKRPLQDGEVEVRGKNGETGLKGVIPVAGLMAALVPGMMDAGLLALREYGTKSFQEAIASAIEDADGYAIDEMRAQSTMAGAAPAAATIATAMPRSKLLPRLGRLAGDSPTVILRCGQSSRLLMIAARIRSLASRSAVSGRPTSSSPTRPFAMSASIATGWPSTPTRATECVRASAISRSRARARC